MPATNLLPQDGSLIYLPHFYSEAESKELFRLLEKKIKWQQDKIKMYGKEHPLPRLQAWYGDKGTDYTYSGIKLSPHPWIKELDQIKSQIEKKSRKTFNSLLLNFYRTGEDYVAWHADKEKELGKHPYIASVSFGGVRRFQLRHRFDKSLEVVSLDLEPGSLVLMGKEIQEFWHHRIVPTKKACEPRINLTFRKVIVS